MQYADAMTYLASFSHLGAPVQDLSRCRMLLAAIGNPQNELRFVHIAGTNGKGSTLSYIAAAAQAAGYVTGSFTSPFIHCFADRIRVNGENISDAALCHCCERIQHSAPNLPFSQFEITMAVALLYFVERGCQLVCWETGIGGRLDATNVVTPVVSVITAVSLDHTAILGNSLVAIAAQKAGIIKAGRPVVLSAGNPPEVEAVVAQEAQTQGAELIRPNETKLQVLKCTLCGSRFLYRGKEYSVSMAGAHQLQNAMTALEAIAALNRCGISLPEDAVRAGMQSVRMGARIEILRESPLLLLDGGHNPQGMAALCDVLRELAPKPIFAVLGVLSTKDAETLVRPLAALAEKIFCVDEFAPNAVQKEHLATLCGENAFPAAFSHAVPEAVSHAAAANGTAVLCGSLYLAAALGDCQFEQ